MNRLLPDSHLWVVTANACPVCVIKNATQEQARAQMTLEKLKHFRQRYPHLSRIPPTRRYLAEWEWTLIPAPVVEFSPNPVLDLTEPSYY